MNRVRLGRLALLWVGLLVLVLLLGNMGYQCPILAATGIPCPSCGMTRAAMALLRLDVAAAWQLHPLVFLLVGEGVWLSAAHLRGRLTQRKLLAALAFYLVPACVLWMVRVLVPLMQS